jgi:hypothetical protein
MLPYRDDLEAHRMRCEVLERELAELHLRVSVLADLQRELVAKEREVEAALGLLAGMGAERERSPLGRMSIVAVGAVAGGLLMAISFLALAPCWSCKVDGVRTTQTSARELRRAAEQWRAIHASYECPTTETLRVDKAIDSASKLTDSWDNAFRIICEDDETTVVTAGPDRKWGTADDIRVPEAVQQAPSSKRGATYNDIAAVVDM